MNMNKKKKADKPPMKYWLVELTLTSGIVRTFYVKAINQFEANKKADDYVLLAENGKLSSMLETFRMMP